MTEPSSMRLTEELILLMLDERSGYLSMVPGWDFACVMAGAVIADLALEGRIDTDLEALHLIDATPTGDVLLDPTLLEMSEQREASSTQYWIERNTARSEEIVTVTLERLVERGSSRLRVGWLLDAFARRLPFGQVPLRRRHDSAGSQVTNSEHRPDRRHSGSPGCHPDRADAHLRRVQARSLGRGLPGQPGAHRDTREDGPGGANRVHSGQGECLQTQDGADPSDQTHPETADRRYPATTGLPYRQHPEGDVSNLREIRLGRSGPHPDGRAASSRGHWRRGQPLGQQAGAVFPAFKGLHKGP